MPPHGIGSSKSPSNGVGLTMSLIMGVWESRLVCGDGHSWAGAVGADNAGVNPIIRATSEKRKYLIGNTPNKRGVAIAVEPSGELSEKKINWLVLDITDDL